MTDQDRLAQLEADLAFLARHLVLRGAGHATPAEHERLREIADRLPRFSRPMVLTSPENETP